MLIANTNSFITNDALALFSLAKWPQLLDRPRWPPPPPPPRHPLPKPSIPYMSIRTNRIRPPWRRWHYARDNCGPPASNWVWSERTRQMRGNSFCLRGIVCRGVMCSRRRAVRGCIISTYWVSIALKCVTAVNMMKILMLKHPRRWLRCFLLATHEKFAAGNDA